MSLCAGGTRSIPSSPRTSSPTRRIRFMAKTGGATSSVSQPTLLRDAVAAAAASDLVGLVTDYAHDDDDDDYADVISASYSRRVYELEKVRSALFDVCIQAT